VRSLVGCLDETHAAIIYSVVSHFIRATIRSFVLFLIPAITYAGSARPVSTIETSTSSPVIVIGFVGGFVRHDAVAHSAVRLAAHLRHDYPSGVYVEVVENHYRAKAYAQIIHFLGGDRHGTLSAEEKSNARVILYGHSWGASEAITLSRQLEREGIPVLLTVQVDSIAKPGENDRVIPANVAEAANFYQLNGFLHGQSQIRAADPTRTHIFGNFRFDYKANPIFCRDYPWYDRVFMKAHIQIECDPNVWAQVEALIRSKLPLRQQ
jgi:hypothetical protein